MCDAAGWLVGRPPACRRSACRRARQTHGGPGWPVSSRSVAALHPASDRPPPKSAAEEALFTLFTSSSAPRAAAVSLRVRRARASPRAAGKPWLLLLLLLLLPSRALSLLARWVFSTRRSPHTVRSRARETLRGSDRHRLRPCNSPRATRASSLRPGQQSSFLLLLRSFLSTFSSLVSSAALPPPTPSSSFSLPPCLLFSAYLPPSPGSTHSSRGERAHITHTHTRALFSSLAPFLLSFRFSRCPSFLRPAAGGIFWSLWSPVVDAGRLESSILSRAAREVRSTDDEEEHGTHRV